MRSFEHKSVNNYKCYQFGLGGVDAKHLSHSQAHSQTTDEPLDTIDSIEENTIGTESLAEPETYKTQLVQLLAKKCLNILWMILWWFSVLLLPPLLISLEANANEQVAPAEQVTSKNSTQQSAAQLMSSNNKGLGSAIAPVDIGKTLLSLFAVIAVILLLMWLMRRFNRLSVSGYQSMRIVSALTVGQREKLLVIDIGDEQIVVGVAPGNVSKIHTLHQKLPESEKKNTGFSQVLSNVIQSKAV